MRPVSDFPTGILLVVHDASPPALAAMPLVSRSARGARGGASKISSANAPVCGGERRGQNDERMFMVTVGRDRARAAHRDRPDGEHHQPPTWAEPTDARACYESCSSRSVAV